MPKPFDGVPKPKKMRELGLTFGGAPLDVAMTPWMPTNLQVSLLQQFVPGLFHAATAVTHCFVSDPSFRARFGYGPLQEQFILAAPGYAPSIPLGRLDCFLREESVKFLEFNTDGTAGWHYSAVLHNLVRQRLGLGPERSPLPQKLLTALLRCFLQWDKKGIQKPRIAIVDWADVPTRPDQEGLAASFEGAGYPCALEDPRALRLKDGRLEGQSGPVDLVYRRVVSEELFARASEVRPFLDAILSGAACCVGSFRTDPAWSKTLFAVFWDPGFQATLPPEDLKAITECVPVTFEVKEGSVLYRGRAEDLKGLLVSEARSFLLKPARGFGGLGVCAGALLSADEWQKKVECAFREGGWVAQEFVDPPVHPLSRPPGFGFLQVGVFLLMGQWAGLMARATEGPILTPDSTEIWIPAEMVNSER